MICARTPIYAIGTFNYTVFIEFRRSGLFSFFVFMFPVSLFLISNALYLTHFTFCYNMILMHIIYFYFDIMIITITYIQYSFTFVVGFKFSIIFGDLTRNGIRGWFNV